MLDVQQGYAHAIDKDYKYLVTAKQDIGSFRFNIETKTWSRMENFEGGLHYVSPFDPSIAVGNLYQGVIARNNYVAGWKNNGLTGFSVPRTTNSQWFSAYSRPFIQLQDSSYYVGLEDLYSKDSIENNSEAWAKYTDFDGSGFKGDKINDYIVSIVNSEVDTNLLIVGFGDISWNQSEVDTTCTNSSIGVKCTQKKLLVSHDKGQTCCIKLLQLIMCLLLFLGVI